MKKILYIGNKLSHHGFTTGVIETLGPQLESEGFKVYYAGTKRKVLFRLIEMLSSILKYRKKTKYILIDTYSTSAFWYAWLSGILCRIMQKRYIHILHGGSLPARLQRSSWFCRQIFMYSFANVAVSAYLKNAFDNAGYPAIVIPNNIDISIYRFKHREVLHPHLLWVRSFHRQYNPNMAANVLSLLLKESPDAKLCMVGPDKDGSMEDFKIYCEHLGVSEHVNITGLLNKLEWHKLSENYSIFINTTNVDNTPVSVIEAMALGLPVVSTNVGGIPFLLEHGNDALLVEKGDAEAMADQIINMIKKPVLLSEIIRNARNRAEEFGWNNVKSRWTEVLK